ncbi:PDZ domain-containing protein [Pelotomaculum terephthalicicum]|uniref:PDZ domain-containing protein n=1 Tax=Pelotomaculum terephthalicicum TaxID=206393 RepID=UPI0028A1E083|nr:PDZ domain-containing protein [Pelotomaculum terephthalicicum]
MKRLFPFTEIIPLVLKSFLLAFLNPQFWPVFLLIVGLIALQYRRMGRLREYFFHQKSGRVWADVIMAAGFGLLGGLAGSCLIVFIGLALSGADLIYLWPAAILLMLIDMRFLCFAYAGGLLAISSLLLGFPQVNIPQIMALVAVLHMVESMLILVSGHLGAAPAFIKDAGGRVVGGFTLQRFWPIPLVVLAVASAGAVHEAVEMPDWWPLIKPSVSGELQSLAFTLMPVVAGLGYSDVSIARSPVEKSRLSALHLGFYSLILLILAVLAESSRAAALAAALFSPLGHETIIYLSRRIEVCGEALYVPPARGMRVLDVAPDTAAWQAGIRSGDIILAVNGLELTGKYNFYQMQQEAFLPLMVDYFSRAAGENRRRLLVPAGSGDWGLVPVPEGNEKKYVELWTAGPLGRWLGKFWGKIQS